MNNDPRTTEPMDRRIRAASDAAVARGHGRARAIGRSNGRTSFAGRFANLGAIICMLALSGCAGNAPQPESHSEPIHSAVTVPGPDSHMCRIDRALLQPARAPDCGFGRSDLKTLDPEQWAHLKVEFEKKCYQRAEKMIRERLRQLQVASRCGFEQASR